MVARKSTTAPEYGSRLSDRSSAERLVNNTHRRSKRENRPVSKGLFIASYLLSLICFLEVALAKYANGHNVVQQPNSFFSSYNPFALPLQRRQSCDVGSLARIYSIVCADTFCSPPT